MNLLFIEDIQDLAIELVDYFEASGDIVDAAADGVTGLHLAITNDYDVIVLDLMLPRMDGMEVCRRLRIDAEYWTPILMLTARDTLEDRLTGFSHGTDDYLIKPFSLRELKCRLNALMRRRFGVAEQQRLQLAGLELDPATFVVARDGRALKLTPVEFQILHLLMRASPKVVRRREIEQAIWGDEPPNGEALRVHIHHLRQAIDKSFTPPLLRTVRGIGYQLAPPDALSS
jgi:DNA-binding response OmpR family regulator